jgi:coenzyme PQQ synthesis protein D (PqqD)
MLQTSRAQDKGDLKMLVRRQSEWLDAKVGDELLMMSAVTGYYVGLSEVGARIWELLEKPQPIETLCGRLREEFDVSDEMCRSDVETFLKELAEYGAVSLDSPPAA